MKLVKFVLIPAVLVVLIASMLGCSSGSDEEETQEDTVATIQKGDLTVDITAAGNLALSRTEDLPIDLFYQEGTVAEVLVEEGDSVEEGQVLVKLDAEEWNDELSALEDLVTTKERALLDAQISLQDAEENLESAKDKSSLEKNVLSAQQGVDNAKIALDQAYAALDWTTYGYESLKAALDKAQAHYDYLVETFNQGAELDYESLPKSDNYTGSNDAQLILSRALADLVKAQTDYDNFVAGYDTPEISNKKKSVQIAEINLQAAQKALDNYDQEVAKAEMQLTRKQGAVSDAEKALDDAKKNLEEAQNKSPELKAPFAGFITKVNVEGGDEVLRGTVAVQLADPNKFEANIMVSEMDILQLQLDTDAYVEVDALQGLTLPAKVTQIAPTATIQSGVVNYAVKVEVQSLEAVEQERQQARQDFMADIAAGEIPAPLQQAIDEGRITQEQVEEMLKNGPPAGVAQAPTGQTGSAVPEDFQLREGLTVTVTIILDQRTDVVLVPNNAITTEMGQSYVQVVTPSGETEKRAIQTGISDYQFTEVTEGLSENEQVLVPQGTTTTSTTNNQQRQGGIFFGGPPR